MIQLKTYTYLTLEEICDWLKIPTDALNLSGDTKASKAIQDLTFTSKVPGAEGNSQVISYEGGGIAGSEAVTVSGISIAVKIADGVSTASQVKAAILASLEANALVSVAITGNGATGQIVQSTALALGANSGKYDARLHRVVAKLADSACEKVESLIDGPVLVRPFIEEQDGGESNVIKPHHWPVVSVDEIRIDYNRAFGTTSIIPPAQYFSRGMADRRQKITDTSIRIIGNDIVLRDDNESFILGRIFSGSVIGSIRLTYKAGWGLTHDDVPSDINMATLQLLEYWYMQRENRDINVAAKGVKGESYTKVRDDIPDSIRSILERYEDVSLGTRPMPQRNYYRL